MIEIITEYFANLFNKSAFIEQEKINHYDQVINGSYKVDNLQIDTKLCINGQAILGKDVLVQKNMLVNGRFIAQHSKLLADLTVNGSASIDSTQIDGNANFRGNLEAKDSILSNQIEILSNNADFDNCKTQNIIIKALPRNYIVQRLRLTNNTETVGDIIFEAGNGEVYCDATSKIQGKIIGGKLIKDDH